MAASIIILVPRKSVTPTEVNNFFQPIDQYVVSQHMIILDQFPRIYFTDRHDVAPNNIRNIINTIKNTQGYGRIVQALYSSTNLQKS